MYIYTFLLRMTSLNIDFSSWDTLYIYDILKMLECCS